MSFYPFWRGWILIFWELHTWKCQKCPKIQNSELLKWSKEHFRDSEWLRLISRKRLLRSVVQIWVCVAMIFQSNILGLIEKMNLNAITDREICCYSISCKEKVCICDYLYFNPYFWLFSTIFRIILT